MSVRICPSCGSVFDAIHAGGVKTADPDARCYRMAGNGRFWLEPCGCRVELRRDDAGRLLEVVAA